jgi:hypothetical protein
MLRNYILNSKKYEPTLREYILNDNFTGGVNPDVIPMCTYLQQFKETIEDNRGFSLNLADKYFIKRLREINQTFIISDLERWSKNVNSTNDPIKTFILHMKIIRDMVFKINNNNKMLVDWDNLPKDSKSIDTLYSLRECIITLSLLTTSRIFELANDGDIINIGDSPSRVIKKNKTNAIIMGSLTLFSDIDISIQSRNASTYIAVIEDLWEIHKDWFNHELWKVDLYGDFTQIGNFYIDTHFFSKDIIIEMLILSVCSFLRINDHVDTVLLQKLVEWCIDSQGLFTTYDKIINYAENKIRTIDKTNRELYYNKLGEAEKLQTNIIKKFKNTDMSEELNNLLGECIIKLGEANLYREENYILTSTVIYIVKIEQGGDVIKNKCHPLYTSIANCSLGLYTYILSAIEQLGYMLHKEHHTKLSCSLPEGKYFGRFIRSIGHANHSDGILSTMTENSRYNKTLNVIADIDQIKKARSKEKNDDITCPFAYNLYDHALKLFQIY